MWMNDRLGSGGDGSEWWGGAAVLMVVGSGRNRMGLMRRRWDFTAGGCGKEAVGWREVGWSFWVGRIYAANCALFLGCPMSFWAAVKDVFYPPKAKKDSDAL